MSVIVGSQTVFTPNELYVMSWKDVVLYACKVDKCKYATLISDDRPYHLQAHIMDFECEDGVPFEELLSSE